MEKENNICYNLRKDDYTSPSVSVIDMGLSTPILSASAPWTESDPWTETEDGGNI